MMVMKIGRALQDSLLSGEKIQFNEKGERLDQGAKMNGHVNGIAKCAEEEKRTRLLFVLIGLLIAVLRHPYRTQKILSKVV
jgi:hypothetical protein